MEPSFATVRIPSESMEVQICSSISVADSENDDGQPTMSVLIYPDDPRDGNTLCHEMLLDEARHFLEYVRRHVETLEGRNA
jgi:hypothetical protein